MLSRDTLAWFVLVCVLAVIGAAPSACRTRPSARAGDTALRVVAVRPVPGRGRRVLALPGSLKPWEHVALYARVTGYLDTLAVDIGDRVDAGNVVATIVVPEMQGELARARAAVASAKAALARERAALDLARLTARRLGTLHARDKDAVAKHDVDVANARVRTQEAAVRLADARLSAAAAEVARVQAMATFAELRAPFDGYVARRYLDPGALVREGTSSEAQPVIDIARTDKLRLVLAVPEPFVPYVRPGTPVMFRLDALPGESRTAKIARVAGALDEPTRSMRAEADVPGGDGLRPGMYASVRLELELSNAGYEIPSRAVRGVGDERYVLVESDGVLARRDVVVVSDDGRTATIGGGLQAEDHVVVSAPPLAEPGAQVTVAKEPAS